MNRLHKLGLAASLIFVAATQTGCATLITATACLASKADDCGAAVAAGAAVDAVVVDAALRSSSSSPSYCEDLVCDEWGDCYCYD